MPDLKGRKEMGSSRLLCPPPIKWLASVRLLSAHLSRFSSRYNPENLATLERYVETQAKENAYDLEANLAVLKL